MDKKDYPINKAGHKIIRLLIGPVIGAVYAKISAFIFLSIWDKGASVTTIIAAVFIFPAFMTFEVIVQPIMSLKIIKGFGWGSIPFNMNFVNVLLWAGIGYGIQRMVRLIARKKRAKYGFSEK